MKSYLLLAFVLVNTQCLVSGILPIRPCHRHHDGVFHNEVPVTEGHEITTENEFYAKAPAQGFIPNILSYLFGPRIRPTAIESTTTVPESDDFVITPDSILPIGLPFDLPLLLPGLTDLLASLADLQPNMIQLPNNLRDYMGSSNRGPVNSNPSQSISALNSNPSLGLSNSIQRPRLTRSNHPELDNYIPHPKLIAGQANSILNSDNSNTAEKSLNNE